MIEEFKTDEISLKELIQKIKNWVIYLMKKWIYILLICVVGCSIGLLYSLSDKQKYIATFRFALDDDKAAAPSLGGAMGLASQFGIELGTNAGGAFSGANLMELMKSRSLVEKALLTSVIRSDNKQISLAEVYIEFNELRIKRKTSVPTFPPNADRRKFTLEQDSILGTFHQDIVRNKLSVGQLDKKISIMNIDVSTEDEFFSKVFAEALVKVVSDFYIETKTIKANNNLAILQKQTDSIRNELNSAITGVASASDNIYNLNPSLNIKSVPFSKRQIDVQVNTAILIQLEQNLELAKVTLRKETPLIQIIDKPILPLRKNKISKRNSVLSGGLMALFFVVFFFTIKRWWMRFNL